MIKRGKPTVAPDQVARLDALMSVLGFEGWGGQKRFAAEIGIQRNAFQKMCSGAAARGLPSKLPATKPWWVPN